MAQMIIANRLRDGLTVFLAAGGAWVDSIQQGQLASAAEDAQRLLQGAEGAAAGNIVVAPYLIEVREQNGLRTPVAWRETIRAFGPTVEADRARS
jgi:hypothetical protein